VYASPALQGIFAIFEHGAFSLQIAALNRARLAFPSASVNPGGNDFLDTGEYVFDSQRLR
ncbi:MAG TPA: hypothetical protein DD676_00425, partial [Halomonas sp.]|nr:hypothetical protein [Halomonas sp.]